MINRDRYIHLMLSEIRSKWQNKQKQQRKKKQSKWSPCHHHHRPNLKYSNIQIYVHILCGKLICCINIVETHRHTRDSGKKIMRVISQIERCDIEKCTLHMHYTLFWILICRRLEYLIKSIKIEQPSNVSEGHSISTCARVCVFMLYWLTATSDFSSSSSNRRPFIFAMIYTRRFMSTKLSNTFSRDMEKFSSSQSDRIFSFYKCNVIYIVWDTNRNAHCIVNSIDKCNLMPFAMLCLSDEACVYRHIHCQ